MAQAACTAACAFNLRNNRLNPVYSSCSIQPLNPSLAVRGRCVTSPMGSRPMCHSATLWRHVPLCHSKLFTSQPQQPLCPLPTQLSNHHRPAQPHTPHKACSSSKLTCARALVAQTICLATPCLPQPQWCLTLTHANPHMFCPWDRPDAYAAPPAPAHSLCAHMGALSFSYL